MLSFYFFKILTQRLIKANNNLITTSRICVFNIILIILLFCCNACKQINDNTTGSEISTADESQIMKVTYGTDPQAEKWYEYDDNGDITRQGAYIDTITYTYNQNVILKKHNIKSNTIQSIIQYKTDENGRIISGKIFDESGKVFNQYSFEYNAEGYLIELIEEKTDHSNKNRLSYEYKNGNLYAVKTFNTSGKIGSRYVYDYYPEKMNTLNLFMQQITDDIFPNERFGKKNKNLIKQLSFIDYNGDTLSIIKYQYLDGTNNNILVQKEIDVLNGSETIISYHLQNKTNTTPQYEID